MPTLDTHLRLDDSIPKSPNLCGRFSEGDLATLGMWVWEGYERDEGSRNSWRTRNQAAMDLALQLQREKSFPWPNCSNIAFPLVTIAAMQFHSRAYPALISGTSIVKYRTPSDDPTGELTAIARAVGEYMSYQVMEEDQAWEEQHDRLLLQVPIVGCAFVKTLHDAGAGHNTSEVVPATKLVMDYYAKSVEKCGRKTHVIELYRNEVYERCAAGTFADIRDEAWYKTFTAPFTITAQADVDKRTGLQPGTPDEATPLTFLEQHCWADFDQDGYAEPYIITIEATQHRVVRIIARWEMAADVERERAGGRVIRIRATEYFTKYELIPSPDGSVYGMGFGVLLGPLNESVNSLVNMLTDAGTMQVAAGGFLGRGARIRGGSYTFSPFGWQRVDSTGDDLRKNIVELPVREPSAVLFTLLSFLVQYTQRISGSTDPLAGENPGQNTPASNLDTMVQEGMRIYSALYKRIWRGMKEEFSKLYILNARFLPAVKRFGMGQVAREWFLMDPSQIAPVADPNVTSDSMRLQQAAAVAERAQVIGGYNTDMAERKLLEAMKIDGIEALFPGADKVQPRTDVKVQIKQMELQFKTQELQVKQQQFVISLMEQKRVNDATIVQLMAKAEDLSADAQSIESGHQIAMIEAMIGAAKLQSDHTNTQIDHMLKLIELSHQAKEIENDANKPATAAK